MPESTEYDELRSELKRKTRLYRTLRERNDALETELASLNQEVTRLRTQIERHTAQDIKSNNQSKQSAVKFEALRLQISDLNRRRSVDQHQIGELRDAVRAEKARADELERRSEEPREDSQLRSVKKKALKIQKENKTLKTELEELHRIIEELKHQCESTKEVANFEHERDELVKRVSLQKEQLKKQKTEIVLSKESCENAYKEVEDIKRHLAEKEELLKCSEEEVKKQKAEINLLKQSCENAYKEAQKSSQVSTGETEEVTKALREGNKEYKRELKSEKAKTGMLEKRIEELECQVLQFGNKEAEVEVRCSEQHSVIQDMHRETERLKNDCEELRKKLSQSEMSDPQVANDESHLNYLNETITTLELQMSQMIKGLEGIEVNATEAMVNADKILGLKDKQISEHAKIIKKSSNKILRILETLG